jgi:hypothetical protein
MSLPGKAARSRLAWCTTPNAPASRSQLCSWLSTSSRGYLGTSGSDWIQVHSSPNILLIYLKFIMYLMGILDHHGTQPTVTAIL